MRKTIILAALCAAASSQATIITQWNFNSTTADANTATGVTSPSTGTGTVALLGGTTSTFASGDASGGSTDPAVGDDSALNVTTWAAQGTDSGVRGVEFTVSTVGYQGIVLTWDHRHSNTSSKWVDASYSTNGGVTWISGGTYSATAGDTWFNNRTLDLSAVSGANNNADLRIRITSIFAPSTSAYATSSPTGTYGTTGTWRFDMATFSGSAVPEPGTMAALGLGAAAMLRRRTRR